MKTPVLVARLAAVVLFVVAVASAKQQEDPIDVLTRRFFYDDVCAARPTLGGSNHTPTNSMATPTAPNSTTAVIAPNGTAPPSAAPAATIATSFPSDLLFGDLAFERQMANGFAIVVIFFLVQLGGVPTPSESLGTFFWLLWVAAVAAQFVLVRPSYRRARRLVGSRARARVCARARASVPAPRASAPAARVRATLCAVRFARAAFPTR